MGGLAGAPREEETEGGQEVVGQVGRETEKRGRARVWREDRGIDRITGFRSRTERWQETKERERRSGGDSGSVFAKLTKNNTLNPTKRKKNPPGCCR